jgi:hypothetical protein
MSPFDQLAEQDLPKGLAPPVRALLVVPAQPVAAFLRQTDAAVPPGTERCRFDLDAELALILMDG